MWCGVPVGEQALPGVQQLIEPRIGEPVQRRPPVRGRGHQTRCLQHGQMRRHRRLGKSEMRGELTDAVRTVSEAMHQGQPRRLGQRTEHRSDFVMLMHIVIHRHTAILSLSNDEYEGGHMVGTYRDVTSCRSRSVR